MMVEQEKQCTSAKTSVEGIMAFDYPFIKVAEDITGSVSFVPLEQARRVFRHSQRVLEKDLAPLITENLKAKTEDELAALKNIIASVLQSVSEEDQAEARLYRERCQKRLKRLDGVVKDSNQLEAWERLRIDRFINEFLLSQGLFETAQLMAQQGDQKVNQGHSVVFNCEQEFIDEGFYRQVAHIEGRLVAGSTTECLQWCHENRAHLKKNASPLEFLLRRQTFVELIRRRELIQAIAYGKKYLVQWRDQFGREIEQTVALLAISRDTDVSVYRRLYDPERWQDIQRLFRKEVFDLHCLPNQPQLLGTLQAGLSALKTSVCGNPSDRSHSCPVCTHPYEQIAKDLPLSHHENSSIVCRITGTVMDENNGPMALPNGRIYSQRALESMAKASDGSVTCPRTGNTFNISQASKVFIL